MDEIPVKHRAPMVPIWVWALGALALLGLAGLVIGIRSCGTDKAAESTPVAAPAPGPCKADEECGDKQLCLNALCTEIIAGIAECANAQVHFSTDSAELREEEKAGLRRMARCLKADQSMKLAIAGNADERGNAEHNAELGEKRAMAVARTLTAQGVSPRQLSVVSYGENNPLCVESDKDCWAKNRRTSLTPKAAPEQK